MTVGRYRVEVIEERSFGSVPADFVGGNEVAVGGIILSPVVTIAEDLTNRSESPGAAAVCHEEGAVRTVVEAPLIGAALGIDFEFVGNGMESPNGSLHTESFVFRSAWLTNEGGIKNAMTTVEPAVVSPKKGVGGFVGVVCGKPVEKDFRRAVGNIVAIGIGDEDKLGCACGEDSAVANFESRDEIEIVSKDFVGFESAIVILVFEYDEAGLFLGLLFGDGDTRTLRRPRCDHDYRK